MQFGATIPTMIIEGIITTEDIDGGMHVSPIGPHVSRDFLNWTLKPFQTSTTFENLQRSGRGVFHVIDDALLMARAVLGYCNRKSDSSTALTQPVLADQSAEFDPDIGWVLADSCRHVGLAAVEWELAESRAVARCSVTRLVDSRPFWGWNRACHSLLELSILVSRVNLLDRRVVDEELARHKIIIDKTAGTREIEAWVLLRDRLSQ